MGYNNINHYYTTLKDVVNDYGSGTDEEYKELLRKFDLFLTLLGFSREQRGWFKTVGKKGPDRTQYIFSGEDVPTKITTLMNIGDMDIRASQGIYSLGKIREYYREDIITRLIQILPSDTYRTVESRQGKTAPVKFNPYSDPRADGIRSVVYTYFDTPQRVDNIIDFRPKGGVK